MGGGGIRRHCTGSVLLGVRAHGEVEPETIQCEVCIAELSWLTMRRHDGPPINVPRERGKLLGNIYSHMAYVIYAIYNLVYLGFTAMFFLYANTYLNGFLIPDSFRWKDGRIRDDLTAQAIAQGSLLLAEATIFAYLLLMLNKWFLSAVVGSGHTVTIATWSGVIYSIIVVALIVTFIYACYK